MRCTVHAPVHGERRPTTNTPAIPLVDTGYAHF
jgi:hypothetical protein